MNELLQSVYTSQSYDQKLSGLFFESQCTSAYFLFCFFCLQHRVYYDIKYNMSNDVNYFTETPLWLLVHVAPIKSNNDVTVLILLLFKDITLLKQLIPELNGKGKHQINNIQINVSTSVGLGTLVELLLTN